MSTFVPCPWSKCPTIGKRHRPGSKSLREHTEFASMTGQSQDASIGDLMRARWDDAGDSISDKQHQEAERIADLVAANMSQPIGDGKVVVLDIDGVQAGFTDQIRPYSAFPDSTGEPPEYSYPGWYPDKDTFQRVHDKVMAKCEDFEMIDDTVPAAINLLRDNGFTVISVTARPEQWRDGTVKFFENNGIPISEDEVFFLAETPKSEIPFDYILDDAPHNIEDAAQAGGVFAGVKSSRYNRHIPELEERVERFDTAMEFANRVIQMEQHRG